MQLPTHCQAIVFPCDWHADYLYVKVKVSDKSFDDLQLLVVFGAENCDVWLHNVEKLCDNLQENYSGLVLLLGALLRASTYGRNQTCQYSSYPHVILCHSQDGMQSS